jgi:hypothetical protein
MLVNMISNTALVMFAMIAVLGLATVTLVVPIVPQVLAAANPNAGTACLHAGASHVSFCNY